MASSTVLKVSNLAKGVSRMQVRDVFKGIKLNQDDIFFSLREDPRSSAVAYIVINDQEEASKAMFRSGRYLDGQKISIVLSNLADMKRDTTEERGSRPAPRQSPRVEKDRSFRRPSPPKPRQKPYDRTPPGQDRRLERPPRREPFPSPPTRPGMQRIPPPPGGPVPYSRRPEPGRERLVSKFVRLTQIPYSANEIEIQQFLGGVLTRKIFIIKNKSGRFVGQSCGEALLEFFSESDAMKSLRKDGDKFGTRVASLKCIPPGEARTMIETEERFPERDGGRRSQPIQEPATPAVIANAVPQLQNLLALLGSLTNVQQTGQSGARPSQQHPPKEGDSFSDPVTMRVARSANVNREEIKEKRVVGIRSLPYTVTPHEIVDFFRGFRVIPNSVRIHYLDDGKSSGDALVSFRSHTEAKNAVNALNRRPMGHRKVELFLL